MIKSVIRSLPIILYLLLFGCFYSITDLVNVDVDGASTPTGVSPDRLEKYTVGNVIVWPRIVYFDGSQTKYHLFVSFYSKNMNSKVSINSVKIKVNGDVVEYGTEIERKFMSNWKPYPSLSPFVVCSISGSPINRPHSEMIKSYVDLSLQVSVRSADGVVSEKVIKVHYEPRKRTYWAYY